MDAIVVGGGIAGLAAAVSLVRAGAAVTVLERAPEFGEIGAGISLTPNGLAALDAIGLGDATRAVGTPITAAGTRNDRGRWLMRMPAGESTFAVGVHRARLHSALLGAAGAADLVVASGKTCWRAVVDDPAIVDDRFALFWGPGAEFGALRTGASETYGYGYLQCAPGAPRSPTSSPRRGSTSAGGRAASRARRGGHAAGAARPA